MELKKNCTIICLIVLLELCAGLQRPFASLNFKIPSLIYQINFSVGDLFFANCSWVGQADLDLYLYQDGSNLLSRSGWVARQYSGSLNPEIMTYTINLNKKYYFRVDLFSSTPRNFKLIIKRNGVDIGPPIYDTALRPEANRAVKQFTTNNICHLKLYYTGPSYDINIFSPGTDISTTPTYSQSMSQSLTTFSFDVTHNGTWNILLNHGITSTTTLININMTLNTIDTNECINFCTNKTNSLGLAPGTTNVCICVDGAIWNQVSEQCLFPFTCNNISNVDRPSTVYGECICKQGYKWQNNTKICKLQCGDGILIAGQQCDDGNNVSSDGCSSTCKKEIPPTNTAVIAGATVGGAAAMTGIALCFYTLFKSCASASSNALSATSTTIIAV